MTRLPKSKRTNSNTPQIEAVSYLRTSSAANAGGDKDSDKRQREAIKRYADASGYAIVGEFYDAAVSGADPIETRPGFVALLSRIESNGVRVVLVEDASRFARDLVTQELGILSLINLGVRVITAGGDDLTNTSDPFKVAMRQIAGAFAQLEKARLVAKLKVARERKRAVGERVEGRKPIAETHPEAVALAKRLHRAAPSRAGSAEALAREKPKRMSLRGIADKLAEAGHTAASGKPFSPSVVKRMLES